MPEEVFDLPPMYWSHRIVRKLDGTHQLHKLYFFGDLDKPTLIRYADDMFMAYEDGEPNEIVEDLENALEEVRHYPILDESAITPYPPKPE